MHIEIPLGFLCNFDDFSEKKFWAKKIENQIYSMVLNPPYTPMGPPRHNMARVGPRMYVCVINFSVCLWEIKTSSHVRVYTYTFSKNLCVYVCTCVYIKKSQRLSERSSYSGAPALSTWRSTLSLCISRYHYNIRHIAETKKAPLYRTRIVGNSADIGGPCIWICV